MRTARGLRAVCAGTVMFAIALYAGAARADDFSTERPGSILIFPKVVNFNKQNTVIQIANTSNVPRTARCFYLNGAPENPYIPPDPVYNPPLCQAVDFEIALSRQQPTVWSVGGGRRVDPTDKMTGLDPGAVPAMPYGFTGALICVEVDDSGAPIAANALKGEATIGSMAGPPNVTKYNAITIEGIDPDGDAGRLDLELDGVEYAACPGNLLANVQAEGGQDAAINALGSGSSYVSTNLTLMPCSVDLESMVPGDVTVRFDVTDEYETIVSGETVRVVCWQSLPLGGEGSPLAGVFDLPSPYGTARIIPTDGDAGLIGVSSTLRVDLGTGAAGTSAANLHVEGNNPSTNTGALIRIRDM